MSLFSGESKVFRGKRASELSHSQIVKKKYTHDKANVDIWDICVRNGRELFILSCNFTVSPKLSQNQSGVWCRRSPLWWLKWRGETPKFTQDTGSQESCFTACSLALPTTHAPDFVSQQRAVCILLIIILRVPFFALAARKLSQVPCFLGGLSASFVGLLR